MATTALAKKRRLRQERARHAARIRWARQLGRDVEAVLSAHPDADPDDVRHTLVMLRMSPWERLERSLRRGRATPVLAR
jgi:hypothetical protein